MDHYDQKLFFTSWRLIAVTLLCLSLFVAFYFHDRKNPTTRYVAQEISFITLHTYFSMKRTALEINPHQTEKPA